MINGHTSPRPWFVEDIRECWKWLSVQIPLWAGAAAQLYAIYGPEMKSHMSAEAFAQVAAIVFWLSIVGRVMNQTGTTQSPKDALK